MEQIKKLYDWLDNRTGIRDHIRETLFENVPGGSRWRYVWGSTLTFALMIQFITGIFLWMGYSPSGQTAWESVYYINNHMTGGHFLRGLHHWTAQVMTVLLVLHLMQVVIDGAYRAPREVNFWFGVILLKLTLALSLTGYLLPWDQKGFWATKVATDILGGTPLVGEYLKTLVLGGADYGHHTLTRFFALHAGILPLSVIGLTAGHIYLFRRHGVHPKKPLKGPDEFFWPEQVLKDAVACLAVLVTILALHFTFNGAHLDAPADPSTNYPARPDWYFLFLFQFLKYFPGHWEILGAIVLPGIAMTLVFLMPIIGKSEKGHKFNVGLLFGILLFAAVLTYAAVNADKNNESLQASKAQAEREAALVKKMAANGIPPEGALALLQGPKLFAAHCASCHTYGGEDGLGGKVDKPSAPDLKGFASREYLTELLHPERYGSEKFFGNTAHIKKSKMLGFLEDEFEFIEEGEMDQLVKAISAEAKLPSQVKVDKSDKLDIEAGHELFEEIGCVDCHALGEWNADDYSAPDLTGYGSREWMMGIVHNPEHERFYGSKNDRMPAFGRDEKLTRKQIERIVDWLRGE